MTYQPDLYVDRIIPTSQERITRAAMALQAELGENAGFVRFLNMNHDGAVTVPSVQNAEELLENMSIEPEQTKAEKKESAKKTDGTALPVGQDIRADGVSGKEGVSKDLKDAEDMWTVDLSCLTADDFKILQNLPVPSSVIQGAMAQANFQHSQGAAGEGHYQSIGVSKGLQNMLEKAYKTQKPIRIDIAENASIILKLSRSGKVSAEFVPGDQVAELFYRQNIQELKSRLESKQLPVGDLQVRSYKDSREGNPQQQQQSQEQS